MAYVPTAHGAATPFCPAQKYPTGQATVAVTVPLAHTYPGVHDASGAVRPLVLHIHPPRHGVQEDALAMPVALEKVPGGHGVGDTAPAAQ